MVVAWIRVVMEDVVQTGQMVDVLMLDPVSGLKMEVKKKGLHPEMPRELGRNGTGTD